jgi:hypothetical protein
VSLAGVLAWVGLGEEKSAVATQNLAPLGQALGVSLRELLVHVRIGFAGERGLAPGLLVARARAGSSRGTLPECEVVLARFEVGYDAQTQGDLRRLEATLREAYERGANESI